MANSKKWHFWVDRGGTFTDIVAKQPDGQLVTHKLLSDNPEQYKDAALEGIRNLMGLAQEATIPSRQIETVKMGTTVATNALLERKGDPTVLVTTKGFGDALRIGTQHRPDIFALEITRPEMLYTRVIEVDERVTAHGEVLRAPDLIEAEQELRLAFDQGIRSVAICFVHGYRFHAHESELAALAQKLGFTQISTSHTVSPLMKYVPRGDTTIVDAYPVADLATLY